MLRVKVPLLFGQKEFIWSIFIISLTVTTKDRNSKAKDLCSGCNDFMTSCKVWLPGLHNYNLYDLKLLLTDCVNLGTHFVTLWHPASIQLLEMQIQLQNPILEILHLRLSRDSLDCCNKPELNAMSEINLRSDIIHMRSTIWLIWNGHWNHCSTYYRNDWG